MKHFEKLVRDKIPAIIKDSGEEPVVRQVDDDAEYFQLLLNKLSEETQELQDKPSLEEIADVLEVLRALGQSLGYTPEQLESARAEKAEARGSFDERIYLISTE